MRSRDQRIDGMLIARKLRRQVEGYGMMAEELLRVDVEAQMCSVTAWTVVKDEEDTKEGIVTLGS